MELSSEDILVDLHAAEQQCQQYEQKYGVLTEDFYKLFINGELECHRDFGAWAAYYEMKKRREEMLHERFYKDNSPKEQLLAAVGREERS